MACIIIRGDDADWRVCPTVDYFILTSLLTKTPLSTPLWVLFQVEWHNSTDAEQTMKKLFRKVLFQPEEMDMDWFYTDRHQDK